jgi:hypothetical protein
MELNVATKLFRVAALLSLAVTGAGAAENPLDAPVVSQAPTLRSEIQRGRDAAEKCSADLPHGLGPFDKCVTNAQADNRQKMGQGFEAFDTGLYFSAWMNMDVLVSSNKGGLLVNDKLARISEKGYWDEYRESRNKIGTTDDAVIAVLFKVSTTLIKGMVADAVSRYGD